MRRRGWDSGSGAPLEGHRNTHNDYTRRFPGPELSRRGFKMPSPQLAQLQLENKHLQPNFYNSKIGLWVVLALTYGSLAALHIYVGSPHSHVHVHAPHVQAHDFASEGATRGETTETRRDEPKVSRVVLRLALLLFVFVIVCGSWEVHDTTPSNASKPNTYKPYTRTHRPRTTRPPMQD